MRPVPVWTRRVVSLSTRGLLLGAVGCGPALPEGQVLHTMDGREFRLLAVHEVAQPGGSALLRVDFAAGSFDDRERSRREARGILGPLAAQVGTRDRVLVVANGARATPWSSERAQLPFLLERAEGKWEIALEGDAALALAPPE
jgi:hypothetical protein